MSDSGSLLLIAVASFSLAVPVEAQSGCDAQVVSRDLDAGIPGPRLRTPDGAAVVGGPFSVQVEGGAPSSLGILFYGPEAPYFDPALGGTIHADPPHYVEWFATDGDGRSALLLATAALDPILCGEEVAIQSAVIDPGAMGGASLSNAVRLRVGVAVEPLFTGQAVGFEGRPVSLLVDDFDGDGVGDLAVSTYAVGVSTLYGLDGVYLSLGTGTGELGAPTGLALRARPNPGLASGDVDGSGTVDLVVAIGDGVDVLPGNGDGTFGGSLTHDTGSSANSIDLVDFDGDGALDLASTLVSPSPDLGVSLSLGNGDGTFAPYSAIDTSAPVHVRGADLDGNGSADLVLSTGALGTVEVARNRTGLALAPTPGSNPAEIDPQVFARPFELDPFLPVQSFPVGASAHAFAVGDLDLNGTLDLAVVDNSAKSVVVLLGDGSGALGPPTPHPQEVAHGIIAVGDLDDDGDPDLAVGAQWSPVTSVYTTLLYGDGAGGFTEARVPFGCTHGVTAGDVDGDGVDDLLMVDRDSTSRLGTPVYRFGVATALRGGAGGSFPAEVHETGLVPDDVEIADFDGDGALDLLTANAGVMNYNGGGLALLLGTGDGSFQERTTFATGINPLSVAAGDLDGDAVQDLVVVYGNFGGSDKLAVMLGNGDGTFSQIASSTHADAPMVGLDDLDLDGALDVFVPLDGLDDAVLVKLGIGNGFLGPDTQFGTVGNPQWVESGDLDGDGDPDLVVARAYFNEEVSVLEGAGDGTFVVSSTLAVGLETISVALADLDDDGSLDLVAAHGNDNAVSVRLGNGDLTFGAAAIAADAFACSRLLVEDLDGNGALDVAAVGGRTVISLFRGGGDGTLAPPTWTSTGLVANALGAGDFDGDGIPDLAVTASGSATPDATESAVWVHLNRLGE